jgi:succinyl-CoA synthetase alpha subunit
MFSVHTDRMLLTKPRFPSLHRPPLFVNAFTKCIIQATPSSGQALASSLASYGTSVAGISTSPESLRTLISQTGANASLVLLPSPDTIPAIIDASISGIRFIVCATAAVPTHDLLRAKDVLALHGTELLGPGAAGVIIPRRRIMVGTFPTNVFSPGTVAIVGRSNSLTFEAAFQTTNVGIGQSVAVGIGRNAFQGQFLLDIVKRFAEDTFTEEIVVIGEKDGESEFDAARWIKKTGIAREKPTVAFIAGGSREKAEAFSEAGVRVVHHPGWIGQAVVEARRERAKHFC